MRQVPEVDGVARTLSSEKQLPLPVVCDEVGTQELRARADKEVELREDGEPDVVGADDERAVLRVRLQ